ncbi:MAG: 2,3-bisphosphoglycerate-independent phosphoglycerate mutase [Gemmatimonadetes bacterium]|nr:2,3-bisphosphoglycerate-independent phosphoglycerate mutase [Gemmatimonadota bacterium]
MRKVLLVILDGWGHSDFGDPPNQGNAVELARVPTFRRLYAERPRTRLACSGADVGLPDGQMGNSEVGHLNLGAGRIVHQDIARIDKAIADRSLAERLGLDGLLARLRKRGGTLHVIGLVSDGGVHSHQRHLNALLDVLPRDVQVRIHALTDGRDTSPNGGAGYLADLAARCAKSDACKIATVTGRYFAMDRDKRWERTKRAYDAIMCGKPEVWEDDAGFLPQRYAGGVTDEFVPPTGIRGAGERGVRAEDAVIMLNFRADRMRQIVAALAVPGFDGFARGGPIPAEIVTMTQYADGLPVSPAFTPQDVTLGLSELVGKRGWKQLKTAETEKYAHVTYFFNGGEETPWPGEDRVLIPSPKVATYDLQPEMSARGVADAVIDGVRGGRYHFILVNFANPDMVGHTGSIPAAVKAVKTVDACLADILNAVSDNPEWVTLVTADHGNCEKMIDEKGNVHTAHTTEPVDLIVFDPTGRKTVLSGPGRLADVAPTVLGYLELPAPPQMDGRDLVGR